MNNLTIFLVFSMVFDAFWCIPTYSLTDRSRENDDAGKQLIDDIEGDEIPAEYRDIAKICEMFGKINGIKLSETRSSRKFQTSGVGGKSNLEEFVSDLLKQVKTDERSTGPGPTVFDQNKEVLEDVKDHHIESRVQRDIDFIEVLNGVCLTDACLAVLRDYLNWRREHGYPVYTGVAELGR